MLLTSKTPRVTPIANKIPPIKFVTKKSVCLTAFPVIFDEKKNKLARMLKILKQLKIEEEF